MTPFHISSREFQEQLSGFASRFDLWASLMRLVSARSVCEVGVWKGEFARAMLERLDCIEQYFMIDPWQNLPDWNKPFNVESAIFEKVYEEAMRTTEFAADRRCVLRGRTKDVASELPDGSLDCVYIDGDHTLRGITIDLMAMWPKVRNNGFIGGDDFWADPFLHGDKYEPTLVCPYAVFFAESLGVPIIALEFGQFLIQKSPEAGFSFTDLTGGKYADMSLISHFRPPQPSWTARLRRRVIKPLLPLLSSKPASDRRGI